MQSITTKEVNLGHRLLYIDYAKAFAIFLVILGHIICEYDNNPNQCSLKIWIYSFHVPLFMVLSGMFFSRTFAKSSKAIIVDKFKQLMLPYFSWKVILFIFLALPSALVNHKIAENILEFVGGGILHGLWYLKCLFIYLVICHLLMRYFKRDYLVAIITIIGFYFLPDFWLSSIMIPFFWFGHYLNKYFEKLNKKNSSFFIIAYILMMVLLWKNDYSYEIGDMTIYPYLLRTLVGCLASVSVLVIFKLIENYIVCSYIGGIGRNTMAIYCCHGLFYSSALWAWCMPDCIFFYIVWSVFALLLSNQLVLLLKKSVTMSYMFLGLSKK